MSYVLIHLVGDGASDKASLLADYVSETRIPVREFRGLSPSRTRVGEALASGGPFTSGVCISHGGPRGIGPTRERIWANAEQLGELFRDRRVYVYGCETTGPVSLATRAIAAGAAVFVGHDAPIEAPLPTEEQRMVATVASAAIIAFIDGTDDEKALQLVIDEAGDEIIPEDIPIDFEAIREQRPNAWSQKLLFDKLSRSLRVHRRA